MASFAMAFGRRRKLIPTVICVEEGSRLRARVTIDRSMSALLSNVLQNSAKGGWSAIIES
jgi:hypothetical protein